MSSDGRLGSVASRIIADIRREDPQLAADIQARINEIEAQGFVTSAGAFTDGLADAGVPVAREDSQVFATVATRGSNRDPERRRFLEWALRLARGMTAVAIDNAVSLAVGAAGTVMGEIAIRSYTQRDDTLAQDARLESSAVECIIDAYSDRKKIVQLRQSFEATGNTNAARLAGSVVDHGMSYQRTAANRAALQRFCDANVDKPVILTFLRYKRAVDLRYLGLFVQSEKLIQQLTEQMATNNPILVALQSDMVYGAKVRDLYGTRHIHDSMNKLGDQLREHTLATLGFDVQYSTYIHLRDALYGVPSEAMALVVTYEYIGLLGARTQGEAEERLGKLINVLGNLRRLKAEGKYACPYGETWWVFGRLLPHMFVRSWDRMCDKISQFATQGFGPNNPKEQQVLRNFLSQQVQRQGAPNFTQFGLLEAMRSQLMSKQGLNQLEKWVPLEVRAKVRHAGLARHILAFERACGANPRPGDLAVALPAPEDGPLISDCLVRVRAKLHSVRH